MGHLQSQIKDLERYIVFLQAKQVSTPTTPMTPDAEAPSLPLPFPQHLRTLSHDTSHDPPTPIDADGTYKSPSISLEKPDSIGRAGKRVTFARETWEGAFEDPPMPQYRLSMTQLDGVACVVDSTHCEWEKMDSLGRALQKTPRVCIRGSIEHSNSMRTANVWSNYINKLTSSLLLPHFDLTFLS